MLLRMGPRGLFSRLVLHSSYLLPFSFSLPLFLPSLPSSISRSAPLLLTKSAISSSTTLLRNSWVSQWIWNLRLELGHQLEPTPLRMVSRLLLPSQSLASRLPCVRPQLLLHPGMVHSPLLLPGRQVASPAKIFLSSPMGHSGVQQGSSFTPMSGVGRPMGACVWCMQPASAVVAPAHCASSVSGMAARPRSRAR